MPYAEIVTIGDELLSGETVDTNSSALDRELADRGWTVTRHTTVADDVAAIADALSAAASRSELVIASGGLGPTQDDLTFEALARALGCGLRLDEDTVRSIRMKFELIGRPMTPNNERQAMVPEVGEVIDNPAGTAPAFTARLGRADVYLLPGVPREVRTLVEVAVGPRIDRGAPAVLRRTLKLIGIGEARVEHKIRAIVKAHPEVRFGYRAIDVENHIKLAATGPDRAEIISRAEAALRAELGSRIFGADADELPAVVGAELRRRAQTIAVAESCTGGLVAKLLTDVPGSSDYVLGGVVTYADEAKVRLLGVSREDLAAHGAVSEPVAEAMARGCRERLGSTWGLALTGIAGPTGGSAEKPVGLVFLALARGEEVETRRLSLFGERAQIRRNAALLALDWLRARTIA